MTPHVTQNQAVTEPGKNRSSATDERTTRHRGYGMSQSRRAMVECIFGWGKQHGTMRTKHRGIARVAADFQLNLIAYNLIRIPCWPLSHATPRREATQHQARKLHPTPPRRPNNGENTKTLHLRVLQQTASAICCLMFRRLPHSFGYFYAWEISVRHESLPKKRFWPICELQFEAT